MATDKMTGIDCSVKGQYYSLGLHGGLDRLLEGSVLNLSLQIILVVVLSQVIHLVLRHFQQPMFASQFLAGLILKYINYTRFEIASFILLNARIIRNSLTTTGLGIFLFVVGVKIDIAAMLKNPGKKKAAVIGIIGNMVPLLAVIFLGQLTNHWEPEIFKEFNLTFKIGTHWCVTSCINLSIFLNEYNLLNSELGQLAMSSSLIGDFFWTVAKSIIAMTDIYMDTRPFLSLVAFVAIIVFVARPIVMRIVRKTPEEQQLTVNHFITVLTLALSCGLFAIVIGQHVYLGMFVFGLVLPSVPPLTTTLVNRLETLVSKLIIPLFTAFITMNAITFEKWNSNEAMYIFYLILLSIMGKMIGVIGSALCNKVTFSHAIILALMMCNKGIYEMELLWHWSDDLKLTFTAYGSILIINKIITGVMNALVKIMYDPSSRHVSYLRRIHVHANSDGDIFDILDKCLPL